MALQRHTTAGLVLALMVTATSPLVAFDHLEVEPGSRGNPLLLVFENTDPQMLLQGAVIATDLPDYVELFEPEKAMIYPAAPPGDFAMVQYIFDVADATTVGRVDPLEFTVFYSDTDSTTISLDLEVVAPAPLARDVLVVFSADMSTADPVPGGTDFVDAVVNDVDFVPLLDDGVPPDAVAGDDVWSGAHLFTAGGPRQNRYLLAINGTPECSQAEFFDERSFVVYDAIFDGGFPQELPLATWELCTLVPAPPAQVTSVSLAPNSPNPFGALTTFAWAQPRAASVDLGIYDVRGRMVAQPLAQKSYPAGRHQFRWQAEGLRGSGLASGIYYLRLSIDGQPGPSRRIVLIR